MTISLRERFLATKFGLLLLNFYFTYAIKKQLLRYQQLLFSYFIPSNEKHPHRAVAKYFQTGQNLWTVKKHKHTAI